MQINGHQHRTFISGMRSALVELLVFLHQAALLFFAWRWLANAADRHGFTGTAMLLAVWLPFAVLLAGSILLFFALKPVIHERLLWVGGPRP